HTHTHTHTRTTYPIPIQVLLLALVLLYQEKIITSTDLGRLGKNIAFLPGSEGGCTPCWLQLTPPSLSLAHTHTHTHTHSSPLFQSLCAVLPLINLLLLAAIFFERCFMFVCVCVCLFVCN